jgi:hypothetical protein
MARSCRLRQRNKLGSFLGYTDRGGNLLGAAALDPKPTFDRSAIWHAPGSPNVLQRRSTALAFGNSTLLRELGI